MTCGKNIYIMVANKNLFPRLINSWTHFINSSQFQLNHGYLYFLTIYYLKEKKKSCQICCQSLRLCITYTHAVSLTSSELKKKIIARFMMLLMVETVITVCEKGLQYNYQCRLFCNPVFLSHINLSKTFKIMKYFSENSLYVIFQCSSTGKTRS